MRADRAEAAPSRHPAIAHLSAIEHPKISCSLNLKNSFLDLLSKMVSLEPGPVLHPLLDPQLLPHCSGGLHASHEALRFHPRGGKGFRVTVQRKGRAPLRKKP